MGKENIGGPKKEDSSQRLNLVIGAKTLGELKSLAERTDMLPTTLARMLIKGGLRIFDENNPEHEDLYVKEGEEFKRIRFIL